MRVFVFFKYVYFRVRRRGPETTEREITRDVYVTRFIKHPLRPVAGPIVVVNRPGERHVVRPRIVRKTQILHVHYIRIIILPLHVGSGQTSFAEHKKKKEPESSGRSRRAPARIVQQVCTRTKTPSTRGVYPIARRTLYALSFCAAVLH